MNSGASPRGQEVEHAGALADFHHPQPQRHDAGQTQGDFKCGLAAIEAGLDQRGKDVLLTMDQKLQQGGREGGQEEADPQPTVFGGFQFQAAQLQLLVRAAIMFGVQGTNQAGFQ